MYQVENTTTLRLSFIPSGFSFRVECGNNCSKHVMLKQEMESYIIIIGPGAQTKTTANKVKTPDDECCSRFVHLHTVYIHGSSLDIVGHFSFKITSL
jgi:hypothetical protein